MHATLVFVLWYLATWCCYELIAPVPGWPRIAGPVVGLLIAGVVAVTVRRDGHAAGHHASAPAGSDHSAVRALR